MLYRGYIYVYQSPAGKYYVGQTVCPKIRQRSFYKLTASYGGHKIDTARRKYGPKSFLYSEILTLVSTRLEHLQLLLDDWESYFIYHYDSFHNGYNGYNGTLGGSSWSGKRDSNLRTLESYYRHDKGVYAFTLDGDLVGFYHGASEASRSLGVNRGHVIQCCKGNPRYRQSGGYVFIYEHDYGLLPSRLEAARVAKVYDNTSKEVFLVSRAGDVLLSEPSVQKMAKLLNVKPPQVTVAVRDKRPIGNYFCLLASDLPNLESIVFKERGSFLRRALSYVDVYDMNGNLVYGCITPEDAAKALGVKPVYVIDTALHVRGRNSIMGRKIFPVSVPFRF